MIAKKQDLQFLTGHALAFVLFDLSLSGKSSQHGVLEGRLGDDPLGV